MECRDAQFYLRLKRHAADELGPDVTGALTDHLAGCPACAADARAAASFDRAMASAMRAVPIPAGLRGQLIAHVASKQGAILRRRFYRAATAAAAAIVLVCLGLGVFSSTRPKVDTDTLVRDADEQLGYPDESTRKWLTAQKLPDSLPLPFDPKLHFTHDVIDMQGQKVPVILYRHPVDPAGFAKVYIFRENGRFDLKGLQGAQASHTIAEVLVGQGPYRGVTYVIVHTAGPNRLNQFFITRDGTQNPL